jgi:hypothetical protein
MTCVDPDPDPDSESRTGSGAMGGKINKKNAIFLNFLNIFIDKR